MIMILMLWEEGRGGFDGCWIRVGREGGWEGRRGRTRRGGFDSMPFPLSRWVRVALMVTSILWIIMIGIGGLLGVKSFLDFFVDC